jgi:chaperonin GroES
MAEYTGLEFPVDELENSQPAQIAQDLPTDEISNVNAADKPVWATEEAVEDIIAPLPEDGQLEQAIQKEALRAEALISLTNIAEQQNEETITDITTKVLEGYKIDVASRKEWEELNKQIIDLAKLLVKKKLYNGEVVANVKYPLIINACIQFAARAYPEIIKGNEVVKGKVIGNDPEGIKFNKAQRVAEFMSFQLLNHMSDWEEGVDQLLFTLPAIGCAFKKSYFDSIERQNISQMVFADDLVVNYYAENLERAPRVTHKIYLYHNEIVERITSGVFSKFDIAELGQATSDETSDVDDETPHLFLEQHRWYDLDNDGYQEPYIVTIHEETQKLVRISARYSTDGIIRKADENGVQDPNGAIVKIKPEQYFTQYLFMPAIDGGFYGMGFGSLLMSKNSAINTIMNQLIDAGTLSNRQNGFLGRGLKLGRGKSIQLKSGEWKPVEATGDDLRKNVFPMPIREPSETLFKLLGLLIESGKELAGMTEILAGNSPGANVPAESVLALIEQGLQVYSAIHKRIHRSQYKEFQKIRRLNALYMDQMTYGVALDDPEAIVQSDFSSADHDIIPVSDPNSTTMMQRLMKAKALLELQGQGLNDMEIKRRYLTAMDVEDIEKFFPQEQEGPDQTEQLTLQKLQAEIEELSAKIAKLQSETELNYGKLEKEYGGIRKVDAGIVNDSRKLDIEEAKTLNELAKGDAEEDSVAKREYGLETNNQGA